MMPEKQNESDGLEESGLIWIDPRDQNLEKTQIKVMFGGLLGFSHVQTSLEQVLFFVFCVWF
jgi:hypothetical protein